MVNCTSREGRWSAASFLREIVQADGHSSGDSGRCQEPGKSIGLPSAGLRLDRLENFFDRAKAIFAAAFEATVDGPSPACIETRKSLFDRSRRVIEALQGGVQTVGSFEGHRAGEHSVDHDTEGIDVGVWTESLSGELFRSDVFEGADDKTRACLEDFVLFVEVARQAKVGDHKSLCAGVIGSGSTIMFEVLRSRWMIPVA